MLALVGSKILTRAFNLSMVIWSELKESVTSLLMTRSLVRVQPGSQDPVDQLVDRENLRFTTCLTLNTCLKLNPILQRLRRADRFGYFFGMKNTVSIFAVSFMALELTRNGYFGKFWFKSKEGINFP